LDKISGVESVGYGRGFAGNIGMGYGFPTMEGEEVTAQTILGDEIYFNQLGLHIIEDFGHPRTNSVWFSKSLANKLMLNDSSMNYYSRKFNMNGARVECVGGVYEDIPTLNAAATTQNEYSAVIIARKEEVLFGSGVMIDVTGEYKETEALIMKAYEEYSADKNGTIVPPAQNGYVQDLLANSLQPVKTAMRLVELFMLLSVLISLLGLIAMSTYYSGENTKSIAIRKAFGSNIRRELWRTVKGYILLVGIAAVIAIPVAVWLCGKYLERFAYRIDHYAWLIAVAVLLTLLMAFLSVLWQTLRAARTNPSNALKSN
jgi:putative ABC transport system permease protein